MKISIPEHGLVCEAQEGETLLAALARSGIILSAPCGGRGICGKCRAKLLSGVLREAGNDRGFLACRGIPVTDISVSIPKETPFVRETLQNEVNPGASPFRPGLPERPVSRAAAALDIGTTTVSARLLDLDTGKSLESLSVLNDQRIFGADVMNRINAARKGKTNELFTLINKQTETLLRQLTGGAQKLERLAASGNTTMLHLFTNTDPSAMGEVPFTPVFLEGKELNGADLSLSAERISLLPSITAFIGADIVAGLGAVGILEAEDNTLFVDIGTNGEMALWKDGKIYCCSTAAGPAFEGAEISCGIGSVSGAVNRVFVQDGKVNFTTIAGAPPRGICGAGLIDAVAVMLKEGIIDETGALAGGHENGFPVTEGITIINRDVRQFQLAKSAIFSGIKILCKNAGLTPALVNRVFIAGGFGFFLDQENAVRAGLLPEEFLGKITACGNTSLEGASRFLSTESFRDTCNSIVQKSSVVELASDPGFMNEFAENMLF